MNLAESLARVERAFGAGAVMKMDADAQPIEVISSGSIGLDHALGVEGYPRGRIVEIFGPESSGKSTLCLHAVANAQAAGGTAAYIDVEHSLDPGYAKAIGVDVSNLLVSQPDTGEQALEICDMLIQSGEITLLIVDSVAALVPRAELEGDFGDSHVGLHSRMMSQAMRKLTSPLDKNKTTAIFVNQLREKIGSMGYGPTETTTGGRALKFYASIRADCRRIETIKSGSDSVGNKTRVKIVKNKLAAPFKEAVFEISYGVGICRLGELIDLGEKVGAIVKKGSWLSYVPENDEPIQLGQGREKARQWLRENPETADVIEARIREAL